MSKTTIDSSTSTAIAVLTPEQLAAEAQAMISKAGSLAGDVIKVKNKKFVLPDGREAETFAAVIIDFINVNEFYEGRYDPKVIKPPVCAAKGTDPKNMVPFDESPKPQADTCNECPNNQFGSEGKGKACKNGMWLSVVPADDLTADPLTVKLAPTATTPFRRYLTLLASTGRPHFSVVTNFALDNSVDYAKIICEAPVPLPMEDVSVVMGRRADAMKRLGQVTNFTVNAG
jgi:hypothetical protein